MCVKSLFLILHALSYLNLEGRVQSDLFFVLVFESEMNGWKCSSSYTMLKFFYVPKSFSKTL